MPSELVVAVEGIDFHTGFVESFFHRTSPPNLKEVTFPTMSLKCRYTAPVLVISGLNVAELDHESDQSESVGDADELLFHFHLYELLASETESPRYNPPL